MVELCDICVLSDDCDLGTGKLSFINSDNFTYDARIDTTNLDDAGVPRGMIINDKCNVHIIV